jgi:HAE1 family hydrophobic/amphiphilic exporter-1
MFLSKVSINRPILTTMLLLVFVVFGLLAYFGLSLNLMPEAEIPYVTVQTIYPGASPKDIETQISKKIEDAVSTISMIDFIESYSMDNVSFVMIAFKLGKNADIANQEVKDKVDAILNNLPQDAKKPIISKFNVAEQPVVNMIVSGKMSPVELYELADKKIKDRFAQIDGVAKVDIIGGQKREIHIDMKNKTVIQNAISLAQLTQILAMQNMNMPAGHFSDNDQEFSVRLKGQFQDVNEIKNLEIPTFFGLKKLGQLARITDTGSEIREKTIYFDNIAKKRNENVIRLSVIKTGEGNPVKISKEIKKLLPELKNILPEGVDLKIVNDSSEFIESSVKDTLNNILLGILFTGLILLFFLHDLRSTTIVALAMPISIVSTFLLMRASGFSLNMLSLMGLSTSVGILVANSVVVIENIFRHMRMGNNRIQASAKGTDEVTVAVIASTLTNIAVFLPLAMMNSIAGQFLKEFALTVTYATLFSLLVSFTLTPMLSSLILPEKKKKHPIGKAMERMFDSWDRFYGKMLSAMMNKKITSFLVLFLAFVIFIVSLPVAKKIGFEFIPKLDEGNLEIKFELPEGYNLTQSAELYYKTEKILAKHKEVKQILTTIGSQGLTDKSPNIGVIDVKLVDKEKRTLSSDEMANIFIKELSEIPNVKFKVIVLSSTASEGRAAIDFYLQGADLDVMKKINDEIITKARNIKGLINFDSNLRKGKPEISLIPKRKILARSGISIYELAITLRASIEGLVASEYKKEGNEYDIKISLTDNSVDSVEKIKNIAIPTKTGIVKLSQLADIRYTYGSTKIIHRNKIKSVEFTGDVAAGYAQGDIINKLKELQNEIKLPPGYNFTWGGMSKMMEDNNREMGKAFLIAILLTYMLLAAVLESFTKPILILMTLPMALIGVFWSLYLFNQTFNMVSMMAVIMLIGIVVNAAILLLDYTMILRKSGKDTKSALIEACPTKLRPIIMSTLAIILGMLPLALGIGSSGAEMRRSLGIVSIGGLIVSTLLTLFVIPAFYYLTTKSKLTIKEKVS